MLEDIQQRKAKLVQILKTQGNAVKSYITLPTSYRKWVWGSKKIIRFWARINQDKLYWPPLVRVIKQLSHSWIIIGNQKYDGDSARKANNSELLKALTEIAEFDLNSVYPADQILMQEIRTRGTTDCSFCGCELVWPTHIVAITDNGEVKKISKEFGIKCLNSHYSRLSSFLNVLLSKMPVIDFSVIKKEMENRVDTPDTGVIHA